MEKFKIILLGLILLTSCVSQVHIPEQDIDVKPGRPRYSSVDPHLQKWLEDEFKKDTVDNDTFWIIIPREKLPPIIKKLN